MRQEQTLAEVGIPGEALTRELDGRLEGKEDMVTHGVDVTKMDYESRRSVSEKGYLDFLARLCCYLSFQ